MPLTLRTALVGTFACDFVLLPSCVVTARPSRDSSVDTENVVSKAVRLRPSTEPYRNLLTPLPTFHFHRTLSHACFAFSVCVVALHLALLSPQTRAVGFRPPVFMIESRASCRPPYVARLLTIYDAPLPQCHPCFAISLLLMCFAHRIGTTRPPPFAAADTVPLISSSARVYLRAFLHGRVIFD
jgi:hypothetical protein